MKTKIYRILLALPVLAMMTACEGMLNLTPEDRVTPATFFNTESNLELFTAESMDGDGMSSDR